MFLLLFSMVFFSLTLYCWRKYYPYFSLPMCIELYWSILYEFYRRREIPGFPFLFEKLRQASKNYIAEGIFLIWVPIPALIVHTPEAIKFFANELSLIEKPFYYRFADTFMRNSPASSEGSRWKKQRKYITPVFYPRMMKNFAETMTDHAAYLVQELSQLQDNTTHDLHKTVEARIFMRFLESALGIKTESAEKDLRVNGFIKHAISCMEFATRRVFRPWLYPDFMLYVTSAGREHLRSAKELHLITEQIIEDMKESYSQRIQSMNTDKDLQEERCKSFGDVLIEEHLKNPSYTIEDMRSDLIVLILGGFDATSISLSLSLWFLGLHPEIQERAYEEIISVADEVIHYEDVHNLTYLECIVKESLRLCPVVPIFARQSTKDLHFGKYTIPSGTPVAFLSLLPHHNPEVHTDPESFVPERFADDNKSNVKPWSLISFAEGVRPCMGKNYAKLGLKIFLAQVIRTFKIVSLTHKEDMHFDFAITLKPSPLSVKFISR